MVCFLTEMSSVDRSSRVSTVVGNSMDGLVKDINRVRFAFYKLNSARFSVFSRVFQKLKMTTIFLGHQSEDNSRIFLEDMYEVLLLEFEDTDIFVSKAFLVYMLYSAYYTQPVRPRVPIRIRTSDHERLESLVLLCKKDNHFDIMYAIRKLQTDFGVHYVYSIRPYGFKTYLADPLKVSHRKLRLANKLANHRNGLRESDLFRRLSFVHGKYCELKVALGLMSSTCLINTNPFGDMKQAITTDPSSAQTETSGNKSDEGETKNVPIEDL